MKRGERQRSVVLLVLGAVALLAGATTGRADEVDDLRQELEVQKQRAAELEDRINQLEARQRLKERAMAEQMEPVQAEVTRAEAPEPATGLPDSLKWLEKIKISGDLRYRHEHIDSQRVGADGRADWKTGRDRDRIRARLMIRAMVNDEWDVALRMASGSVDVIDEDLVTSPVSANQTLTQFASSKSFWLDLAYFDYHPMAIEGLNVIGGKMPTPFYRVGQNQIMWDGDLNPEGMAVKHALPLGASTVVHVNGGGFWLNEESSGADTSMWGIQAYLKQGLGQFDYLLAGAGFYDYGNLQGLENEFGFGAGNTIDPVTSEWVNDYDILEVLAEYGTQLGTLPLAVFGTWVQNTVATTSGDTGWLVGATVGKAKAPGSWQFGYDYRDVERDAVLAIWNDSDWSGGLTGAEGHTLSAAYQLAKNVQLALTYFHCQITDREPNPNLDYRRLHGDLKVKI